MMTNQVSSDFVVRFWGVRGSYPVPGAGTVRYGGNTSCVELEVNGLTLILDAGTGLVPLGKTLVRRSRQNASHPLDVMLLLSHLHHDHTQGFPFFVPAYVPGAQVRLFGPDFLGSSPEKTLEAVMQPPYFPLRLNELSADLSFQVLRDGDALLLGPGAGDIRLCSAGSPLAADPKLVCVRVLRSYAHPGGVLHYRIDWQGHSLVYATDTEGYVNGDRRLAKFARGADLLIHDAQYTDEHYLGMLPGASVTQGFGHSTVSMACQAAHTSGVKRLVLFHHAPEYSDEHLDSIATSARSIFPLVDVAREGMEIHLGETQESQVIQPAAAASR